MQGMVERRQPRLREYLEAPRPPSGVMRQVASNSPELQQVCDPRHAAPLRCASAKVGCVCRPIPPSARTSSP